VAKAQASPKAKQVFVDKKKCQEGIDALGVYREKYANNRADPIAEKLDELASLGEYWQRNREKGRQPRAVRAAMIIIVREIKDILDRQRREKLRDGR